MPGQKHKGGSGDFPPGKNFIIGALKRIVLVIVHEPEGLEGIILRD